MAQSKLVSNGRFIALAALVLLALSACTNNDLDDAGGPNVVLEVTAIDIPVAQGDQELGTCSVSGNDCLSNFDCTDTEFCILPVGGQGCEIQPWSITLANVPKTPLAVEQPFSDVTLTNMIFTFTWPSGFPTSTVVGPYIGLTVPANGTADLEFLPISEDLLVALEGFLGTGGSATASVDIVINGLVQDSDAISVRTGGVLSLQDCLRAVGP